MRAPAQGVTAVPDRLAVLRPLVGELMDLKRVRTPDQPDGLAAHGFRRAWAELVSGADPDLLALRETALALTGVRLGGIDLDALSRAGLPHERAKKVLRRGFEAAAGPLDPGSRGRVVPKSGRRGGTRGCLRGGAGAAGSGIARAAAHRPLRADRARTPTPAAP